MKFPKVALILVSAFFFVAPQVRAQDPEAERILREVSARYEKLGTFSVSSIDSRGTKESVLDKPQILQRIKAVGRFGENNFAALKADIWDGKKTTKRFVTQLRDGENFYVSRGNSLPTISRLSELRGAKQLRATRQFFSNFPGFQAIFLLLDGERFDEMLPASQSQLDLETQELANGNTSITALAWPEENAPIGNSIEIEIGKNGFLKEVTATFWDGQDILYLESQLSTPVKFQNPALFEWKNLAPKPNPNFQIPAEARAPFERAARFYGALDSFSATISAREAVEKRAETEKTTLHWVRRGLLNVENAVEKSRVVVDGKTRWNLREIGSKTPKWSSEPLDVQNKDEAVLKILAFASRTGAASPQIAGLLSGMPLILGELENYTHLRARKLSDAKLGEVECEVVEALSRSKETLFFPSTRFESLFFFAKDNGRLLEIREKTQSEEGSAQSLIRLENQKFNPTLPFSLFRFQKPKNAVPIEQFAVGILK